MNFLYNFLFLGVAVVYSMAGLGGGSIYVGLFSASDMEHRFIPSTSLFLNMVVTSAGFFNYRKHINFKEKNFLIPLYFLSIAGVYLGTKVNLNLKRKEFLLILGILLILSAVISFFKNRLKVYTGFKKSSTKNNVILFCSFIFGFFAGLVGIAGGVFLSPLLLIAGFHPKEIAGITSLYVFLNSTLGFMFHYFENNVDFSVIFPCVFFVFTGGIIGSYLGSFRFNPAFVNKFLIFIIFTIGTRIILKATR